MNKNDILVILRRYKANSKYSNNIIQMGLFGSVVTETFTAESDIDIFVELRTPRMFDLIGIKQDLEELTGKRVDIVMLQKRMNTYLKKVIQEQGVHV